MLTPSSTQQIDPSTVPRAVEMNAAVLPKITVITPSYNQASYLRETCNSIVAQHYPNLEWFICDGGSTDGSVDVIQEFAPHLTWWVSEKDRGQTDALNKGYARATGEICCFVNSDDVLEPGALHYAARAFTPDVNWIVGWAKYFDNSGDEWVYGPHAAANPVDLFLHNPVPQIASFWRTRARDKVGPFDATYNFTFDYEYWMRLFFDAGWRPKMVRRCLGGFRLHNQSKSMSLGGQFMFEGDKIWSAYQKHLSPAEMRQWKRGRAKLTAERQTDCAWQTLKAGDKAAAQKHGWAAVKADMTSAAAWRAWACAVRGH